MTWKIFWERRLRFTQISNIFQSTSQTKTSSTPKDSIGVQRHHHSTSQYRKLLQNPPRGQRVKHRFYQPRRLQKAKSIRSRLSWSFCPHSRILGDSWITGLVITRSRLSNILPSDRGQGLKGIIQVSLAGGCRLCSLAIAVKKVNSWRLILQNFFILTS